MPELAHSSVRILCAPKSMDAPKSYAMLCQTCIGENQILENILGHAETGCHVCVTVSKSCRVASVQQSFVQFLFLLFAHLHF